MSGVTRVSLRRGVRSSSFLLILCLAAAAGLAAAATENGPPGRVDSVRGFLVPSQGPPPACGNHQCDPGEDSLSCPEDCPAVCGNGVLEPGEECDDGNTAPGDGCSATCTVESFCGDGICDPGAGEDPFSCPEDCPAVCGNGVLEPGEECDDGNTTPGDGCSAACTVESFCGDAICDAGAGEDPFSCPEDCPAVCGNGLIEPGEECDDGNTTPGDGCSGTCTVEAFCGNGVCDPGEDPLICPEDCPAVCGNGALEPGEECDDGNTAAGDGCSAVCTVESTCGNGLCEPVEDSLSCPEDCPPVCGNGLIEPGEECDDGNTVGGDGCSAACTVEIFCGNGVCDAGEDPLICPEDCPPVCGNGILEPGEECDDGNVAPGDGCSPTCTVESFCGDGICDIVGGENSFGCPEDCLPVCGNGLIEPGEDCDDGNTAGGDGCSATCTAETFCGNGACDPGEDPLICPEDCPPVCANGILEPGEECDDGNTVPGDGCTPACTLEDPDGDGILAPPDNCPFDYNPGQADSDGDMVGDACDCSSLDPLVWATPGEVPKLLLDHDLMTGITTLNWSAPADPGGVVIFFDVLRTTDPADFVGPAVCLESNDVSDLVALDGASPGIGGIFYYEIRAENTCLLGGIGPLGFSSAGVEHPGRACP